MSVTIDLSDREDIVFLSQYHDKDLVKQVPGVKWDQEEKVWRAPCTWSTCKAARGIFGDKLVIGERLRVWANAMRNGFIEPMLAMRLAMDDDKFAAFESRLFDFQRPGARFVAEGERQLLCDDMGSGKTVQYVTALRWWHEVNGDGLPALIVCPRATKVNPWLRTFETFFPAARVVILRGTAAKRKEQIDSVKRGDADVLIVHWEQLRIHSKLAGYGSMRLTDAEKAPKELNEVAWRAVCADEVHRGKNPQSKQTRALWALGHAPSVRYRTGMTGTILGNAPDDAWSPLHFIDPKEWPAKTRFVDRYCLSSWNSFGGLDVVGLKPETSEEFYAVLDPRMRRMPKSVTLGHLPPLLGGISNDNTPDIRYAEFEGKQKKAYDEMETRMVVDLERTDEDGDDVVIATNAIAQATRLQQFASSYAEIDDEGKVRLTMPSNKIDTLLEVLEETAADDHVVVFAQSAQLIRLAEVALQKEGYTTRMIIGGQSEDERQRNIDEFQDGKAKVMLVTIAAGGTGITLTKARVCVFMQRSFSMLDNLQAEARVHRIGSEIHDTVQIIDIVSEGTIDERVLEVLTTKTERLEEVFRDKALIKWLLVGDKTRPTKKRGK